MKILCICGSPRPKGNSAILLQEAQKGIEENLQASCENISAYKINISACLHCDSCQKGHRVCVQKDDTKDVIDKIEEADVLIFSTPVYWWGMSTKLKLIVDKFYSRVEFLKQNPKKVIVLNTGAEGVDNIQHSLIEGQFKCISEYLNWELKASLPFCAYEAGEIAKNKDAMQQASDVWKILK